MIRILLTEESGIKPGTVHGDTEALAAHNLDGLLDISAIKVIRSRCQVKKARAAVAAVEDTGPAEPTPLVWQAGTPKSDASTNRVVPLAPWLADDLRQYLTTVHPFAGKHPHAPAVPRPTHSRPHRQDPVSRPD